MNSGLCVGLDHLSESGPLLAGAGSDGIGTMPGQRSDDVNCNDKYVQKPGQSSRVWMSKRQRKRQRDNIRKKKLVHKALTLETVVKEKTNDCQNMQDSLMFLKAQKGLLARRLDVSRSKIASLTRRVKQTNEQAMTSSYGLRLLRTVSGTRNYIPTSKKIDLSKIKVIDPSLINFTNSCDLGAGKFGHYKTAKFYHYEVCVKIIEGSDDIFLREAYFINTIGFHKNIPYLFGIIKTMSAIVMSCHTIENKSVTIYEALEAPKDWIPPTKWPHFIIITLRAVLFLHEANIIHNDIKGDNFVFGTTASNEIEPVLIDFGKACYIDQGKSYNLNEAEKLVYKEKHCHIAPDLRDGITKQNEKSDIYAFGHLLLRISKKMTMKKKYNVIAKLCLTYNEFDRPTGTELETMILKVNT